MSADFGLNSPKDTIVAVSTPRGEAAICVIRASGGRSKAILEDIFRDLKGHRIEFKEPRKVAVGYVVNPNDGQIMDEVQAVFFRNPKTYTGEDMFEIYGHGGLLVCDKVLEAVRACGARLAERGEFTLRAFINGKMDLASAEAVLDVITARNEKALLLSLKNLRGGLCDKIRSQQRKLHELLSRIEVDIEYPDESFELPQHDEILQITGDIAGQLKALIESYGPTRILREGVKVAIVGEPNVGKSSLMNRLLQRERAIVHHEPGTTRDLISDWLPCGGIDVLVMDTAGLTESDDPVEREGVLRARNFSREADIIFYVVDVSAQIKKQMATAGELRDAVGRSVYYVFNKIDMSPALPTLEKDDYLKISALTGEGIEELKEIIRKEVEEKIRFEGEFLAINERQRRCLEKAVEALEGIGDNERAPVDILAIDLQSAAAHLGEIFGEQANEGILKEIFNNFCVGK